MYNFKKQFFYLLRVFIATCELPLVVASGVCSVVERRLIVVASLVWSTGSRHVGFGGRSTRAQQLWSRALERTGSIVVARGPGCSVACAVLPDGGSALCPLHWQADSHPLYHQGSPFADFIFTHVCLFKEPMRRANSLGKTPMLGKIESRRRRG